MRISLRWRLLALTLLIALPAFGLLAVATTDQRQHEAQEAKERALALVRQIAFEQGRLVDETRVLLTTLASVPQLHPAHLTDCQPFLADLLQRSATYANLLVATPDGAVVCAAEMPETPLNLADREYFQRALATRTFVASGYLIGRVLGIPVMVLAMPIQDADGAVAGLVVAALDLAWLNEASAAALLPAGTTVTVFDQQGAVLAHSPHADGWIGRTLPASDPLVQTILAAQGEGTYAGAGVDGVARLTAYTRLSDLLATSPVYVSVGIPTAVAYAEINQIWQRSLAWLGLMTLVMAVCTWLGSDLLVLRRVRRLVQATHRLAAGDLGTRTGITSTGDEIGKLGDAFDRMAAALQQQAAAHRQAEAHLRELEELYRRAIAAAGAVPYRRQKLGDGWAYTFIGAGIEQMTGYAAQEMTPDVWQRLTQDHEFRGALAGLSLAEAVRRVWSGEVESWTDDIRIVTRHGAMRWVADTSVELRDAQGHSVGSIGMLKDISDRKQTEEELRQLSRAVEQSPAAIVITNATGAIEYSNPKFCQLSGYTLAEVRGRHLGFLAAGALSEEEGQPIWQTLRAGNEWRGELPEQRKNGDRLWVSASISPVFDAQGLITSYVAVQEDITLRKQLETDLRQARVAAEAAAAAKSEFLANMSHEIRTPMNAIIGMTGLLLDTPLTAEQHEFTETIRSSGDALLTLINDILDFSKIETGKLDLELIPFDLAACIEDTLDLFAAKVEEKGLELGYLLDPHIPQTIVGDPSRLRQILTNLVGNAVKFTGQGEVIIQVDSQVDSQADRRSDGDPHPLHFAVRDTGIGISPQGLTRLFQSFSQADASTTRRYGGTGLGLAISRRLSELMGGRMWVESALGCGSTFHFTIQAQAAPTAYRLAHRRAEGLAGKRVLLVDDHPVALDILTRQVRTWQLTPVAVTSGAAALALLAEGATFDCAILDRRMPEMDGLTLAARLRQHPAGAALPLVMLSSVGHSPVEAAALSVTMLSKPVKPSQLQKVLVGCLTQPPATAPLLPAASLDGTLATRLPRRILLAEDNLVNQKVAVQVLARLGYRVEVAANGVEVLEALQRQTYDVVLMDVQMPEMDGLEATRRIGAQWAPAQRPYIIAMTAHALAGDAEKCLAAGMDAYLSKPIQIEKLVTALEHSRRMGARIPAGGGPDGLGPTMAAATNGHAAQIPIAPLPQAAAADTPAPPRVRRRGYSRAARPVPDAPRGKASRH